MRIDDPWLAEAWRDQQFGGSNTRWAADVIGKYAVTAGRLLDSIIANENIQRVFVCGTSQLTLALCANMTRRHLERDFYTAPGSAACRHSPSSTAMPRSTCRITSFYRQQAGVMCDGPAIDAVAETPTASTLQRLIGDSDPKTTAAILVDSHVSTTGARLAARFPEMPVYAWDPKARGTEDPLEIVGMLQPYGLALDTREGQVQDAWERAARLIHERYAATIDPKAHAVAGGDAMGRAQRVLPRVQPTSGAQRAADGRTDRGPHLEHLGQPAGGAVRSRHGRFAATGTTFPDGLRPLLGDEHGEGRTRGLVPLLPPQRLEVRFAPRRLPQDPRQAGRLVGGRKQSGSAQRRGAQLGGHAVASAPARLSVTSAVANLHPGRDGHRRTTKRTVDMDNRIRDTPCSADAGDWAVQRGRQDVVGAR